MREYQRGQWMLRASPSYCHWPFERRGLTSSEQQVENEQALEWQWVVMMSYYGINRPLQVDVMSVIEYGGGGVSGDLWRVLVMRADRQEGTAGDVRGALIWIKGCLSCGHELFAFLTIRAVSVSLSALSPSFLPSFLSLFLLLLVFPKS